MRLYIVSMFFSEERNRADQTIHDIESKLNEYKDQLDADEVKTLQEDAARVSIQLFIKSKSAYI